MGLRHACVGAPEHIDLHFAIASSNPKAMMEDFDGRKSKKKHRSMQSAASS